MDSNLKPKIITPTSPTKLSYGWKFVIRFQVGTGGFSAKGVAVPLIAPSFTTHSFSMNHRLLFLISGRATTLDLVAFIHVINVKTEGSNHECGVHPELGLEIVNYFFVHLEGFGENIVRDGGFRSKNRVSYSDNTWVLTAESSNGYSRCMANIGLKVNEANWEDKHITLVKDLCYEGIIVLVGEDKADVEHPFEDRQYLSGTWVRVRRVLSIRSEVYASQGDAKSIEPSYLVDKHWSHFGPNIVRCVAWFVQALKEEIICLG
ncbi:aldehyde oxidase GLOX-like protein [Cinnamomum micranthum f. kanehirae]|uniref:Aldehyde oxidase GLOX-like protein n=1 Tax=Cinnamomum micranthum f. kanehirae TaxID=337451 RepID=A0A3S3NP97_9MAGN|nr:aldehyde oxidase GLOX-like protein [Cinnamomum micranthum f. kanehirae]